MNWKNKKVVVTGANGMIGKELVEQLEKLKATVIRVDKEYINDGKPYWTIDLSRELDVLDHMFNVEKPEVVFHLVGIKGSPKMTKEKPLDFMFPMLQCDTNMIKMSIQKGVKRFLYTSSIAVENPETDKYPAWAKMTGEKLLEAARIQYPEFKSIIVRPANVYGNENLNRLDSMVITSLINKALTKNNIEVWGDGSEIRDFIYARDVAKNMIKVMEEMPNYPINLCSSIGISIKQIAEIISKYTGKPIVYLNEFAAGDKIRIMKKNYPIEIVTDIETGIKEVIEKNKNGME